MRVFQGRLGLQQRVLPAYRVEFFDRLADRCQAGMCVFAGRPLAIEEILTADRLNRAGYVSCQNVHFGDPSSSFYLCWQKGIVNWLREWDPQALIVEANPRYLSTRLAINWMHRRGRPVIGWGLGAIPISGWLRRVRLYERKSFVSQLDGIIAYSHQGASEYRALGIPPERIFIAANAVAPQPDEPPPLRLLPQNRKPVLLFVGRLQERKRIDHLLLACSALPEAIQPRLIIVGDGPAYKALTDMAKRVYPTTEFVGAKRGDELSFYFEQADLFVLPGSGGLAAQQAMTHGLPLIIAEGDGTQNMLVRPENGWLVPPNDWGALKSAIEDALSDISRLRQMGLESYRIVRDEINIDMMVEVFVEALETLKPK